MFEHYLIQGDTKLRLGFTTGTAASLALKACLEELLSGQITREVALMTPKGLEVRVEPERQPTLNISYGVKKDGGDDIDATDGALIVATIKRQAKGITIEGGTGVGRVTKAGLNLPIGQAAINPVPRRMMSELIEQMLGPEAGLHVTISVPRGEDIARRTFNPQLGIVGGISIIGTSGIVEPRSHAALIETIRLELAVQKEAGQDVIILTPGNLGEAFAKGLPATSLPMISYSNYLGETLDRVTELGFNRVFLVSHIGKLSKVAAGIMNTHSRQADGRREVFCAHSALAGIDRAVLQQMMAAVTTDAMIDLIRHDERFESIINHILQAAIEHIERRLPRTELHVVTYFTGGFVASHKFLEKWNEYES